MKELAHGQLSVSLSWMKVMLGVEARSLHHVWQSLSKRYEKRKVLRDFLFSFLLFFFLLLFLIVTYTDVSTSNIVSWIQKCKISFPILQSCTTLKIKEGTFSIPKTKTKIYIYISLTQSTPFLLIAWPVYWILFLPLLFLECLHPLA